MKCKCGNIIPFWNTQFQIYKCDDCRFVEDIKEKISAIKMVIKKDPKTRLSKLAKNYISIAIDKKILTKEDNFLTSQFS